jgi:predicted nucleic acid-binding protein
MIVFDAGALVALDKNDSKMWAIMKAAALRRTTVFAPSTVIAQVWRGSPRQARLAIALQGVEVSLFDPMAKAAGELCGTSRTSDVVDASVVLTAVKERAKQIYTSDDEDIQHLLDTLQKKDVLVVHC